MVWSEGGGLDLEGRRSEHDRDTLYEVLKELVKVLH